MLFDTLSTHCIAHRNQGSWLTRRTHRVFNYGLVTASAALIISVVWLVVTYAVARSDPATG